VVVRFVAELLDVTAHDLYPSTQSQTGHCPLKRVSPLGASINENDVQVGPGHGDDQTRNASPGTKVGTCCRILGDCLNETQGMRDHLDRVNGTERSDALRFAKDAQ
jgi:hypothetical protein